MAARPMRLSISDTDRDLLVEAIGALLPIKKHAMDTLNEAMKERAAPRFLPRDFGITDLEALRDRLLDIDD